MGQPAARLGDATAHGGAITSGNPTVLIGGQPAATMGDLHVCPMCSPGPHVGGPVLAGAPTVLIGGKPAARVGDQCVCAAPAPDVILTGAPTVLIGGASGASSGAAAAAASAHGATAALGTPGLGAEARPLSPWVGVGYTDAAGRPVTGWHYRADGDRQRDGQLGTGGQVWCDALAGSGAVEVGLVGVYACRWSEDQGRVGNPVGLSARCVGAEDGADAVFEVWRDAVGPDGAAARSKVAAVPGTVRGTAVEADEPFVLRWPSLPGAPPATEAAPEGDDPPPYEPDPSGVGGAWGDGEKASARYTARVVVGGVHAAWGPPIRFLDRAGVTLRDPEGQPVAGATVQVEMSSGEVKTLTTDTDGSIEIVDVDPGRCVVTSVQPPTR